MKPHDPFPKLTSRQMKQLYDRDLQWVLNVEMFYPGVQTFGNMGSATGRQHIYEWVQSKYNVCVNPSVLDEVDDVFNDIMIVYYAYKCYANDEKYPSVDLDDIELRADRVHRLDINKLNEKIRRIIW